jgi:phosphoribosylanthranilate isomerase
VFVNPTVALVLETLDRCQLQAAQVHRVGPPLLRELLDQTQGWVYPAVQPRSFAEAIGALPTGKADEDDAENATMGGAPWIPQLLIDAFHPDMPGGTGQSADLGIARRMGAGISRLMLAGGLAPGNVASAAQTVRPWAVDVSSGVEAAPGRKDHEKVRAFIHAVRQFDEEFV